MGHGWLRYAGIFLLSAWMFFVGVLVGRGTSPVEFDTEWFQKRLAVVFGQSMQENERIAKPQLDFYDMLRRKGDGNLDLDLKSVANDSNAMNEAAHRLLLPDGDPAPATGLIPQKKSRKAMTVTLRDHSSLDGDFEAGHAVTSQVVPVKIRSEKAMALADDRPRAEKKGSIYTIQIASYPNQSDAMKHVAQLQSKGYQAYHYTVILDDKTWYRVRSGAYEGISDAQRALRRFQREGVDALIIKSE